MIYFYCKYALASMWHTSVRDNKICILKLNLHIVHAPQHDTIGWKKCFLGLLIFLCICVFMRYLWNNVSYWFIWFTAKMFPTWFTGIPFVSHVTCEIHVISSWTLFAIMIIVFFLLDWQNFLLFASFSLPKNIYNVVIAI